MHQQGGEGDDRGGKAPPAAALSDWRRTDVFDSLAALHALRAATHAAVEGVVRPESFDKRGSGAGFFGRDVSVEQPPEPAGRVDALLLCLERRGSVVSV